MNIDPKRLKSFLLDAGLAQGKDFDEALKISRETGKKIGDVLVEKKIVDRERLSKFEAYLAGVPFVNIENETIAPETLRIIPEQVARAHNIIAFRKKGNNLEIAMLDPGDLAMIEFIKKADPLLKILPRLTTPEGVKSALKQYQKTLGAEFEGIVKEEAVALARREDGLKEATREDLAKTAREIPVIKVVDALLKHAILQRASDIHIEPLEKETIVRFRVDGILSDVMSLPAMIMEGISARIKVLSNLKLDERRLPQDGRFKVETDDYKYSVRVSILPVINGEKIVMRLLAENVKVPGLEALGLEGEALETVKNNLVRPTGMILITGPTGSGKTTTLYSMMEILNSPKVNISTVEDPIEYRMPRINQTQVNPKIGLSFAAGLRALVRQDPNVIMVGEIRDNETAGLAINAALTGHLVLSTLHTTGAAGAIPRLADMKAEPFLIASTLNVIIAQRLTRKLWGEKEKYRLSPHDLENLRKYCDLKKILKILKEEKLAKSAATLKDIDFYKPKPSTDCPSGYRGRIGIFEVLPTSDAMKEMIVKKSSSKEIAALAVKEGMRTMVEDGFVKAAKGLTTIEEVLRVITD